MRVVACLLSLFLISLPIRAENVTGYTAEWLSHQSGLIALAVPTQVEKIKGPGEVWFTKTRFRLDDVLKGPESNGDTVTVYDYSNKTADLLSLSQAMKDGRKMLLFCEIADNRFREINGKYGFTEAHQFKSAYYVDQPVTELFTPDFSVLSDFEQLLQRTRAQIAKEVSLTNRNWRGVIKKKSVEVPPDSEAHRHLYAGSACFLWVPDYAEN